MSKRGIAIRLTAAALILVLVGTANILAFTTFDSLLSTALGGIRTTSEAVDLDGKYYDTAYASALEVNQAERAFNESAAGEGIVLLKRDEDSRLPYAEGTTFSLFSHSSVDMIYGGTGSGSIGGTKVTIRQAFEERGLKVNETLWNFYESGAGSSYKRGIGSYDFGQDEFYQINECPVEVIEQDAAVMASLENTVAVFVLSRIGGEGRDVPRGMVEHATNPEDQRKHYLELDSTELALIAYLDAHFEDVLILVNSNNAVELGWVNEYPHIHTVLSVPGVGTTGMYALPEILLGHVNPSGHLVDTYAYDLFSSPAAQNCDETIAFIDGQAPTGGKNQSFGEDEFIYYTVYEEGIYVGYRYYETRYEDAVLGQAHVGDYDYLSTVQYPFGYGLSLTDFAWSDFSLTEGENDFTVSVTVTNTGKVAGKDVVQIYLQKPYTAYDEANRVEKSAVELVEFAKTGLLAPGEQETVTASFSKQMLASYDYVNAKTYIVDEGTYYVTAARDAHAAVNNILRRKAPEAGDRLVPSPTEQTAGDGNLVGSYTQAAFDRTTYAVDHGVEVTNQLDFGSLEDVTYLSRSDWTGTFPTPYGTVSELFCTYGNRVNGGTEEAPMAYSYRADISRETYQAIRSTDSLNPIPDAGLTDVTTLGEKGIDLELIELRGAAFDDPRWDTLISKMTATEITELINQSGYGTRKAGSISKPAAHHSDGPSGFKAITGNESIDGYGFMCAVVLAQTWNKELAHEKGNLIGEESLLRGNGKELNGWYGPAMNTHRTPFSGRNFEYYSEDGVLAGLLGQMEVLGAAEHGLNSYIKHFAFNDSEGHRGDKTGEHGKGEWGICTWLNEQAAREIYLKPFEMCVKAGTVEMKYYGQDENGRIAMLTTQVPTLKGIMSSFNRIGVTWAGGCYPLITNIVRGEWGYNGYIVTDFDNGEYMDTEQMLRAGADAKLVFIAMTGYDGSVFKVNSGTPGPLYHYVKDAMHHILYTEVNSSGMNGISKGVTVQEFPYYKIIAIAVDVLALAGILLLILPIVRKKKARPKA